MDSFVGLVKTIVTKTDIPYSMAPEDGKHSYRKVYQTLENTNKSHEALNPSSKQANLRELGVKELTSAARELEKVKAEVRNAHSKLDSAEIELANSEQQVQILNTSLQSMKDEVIQCEQLKTQRQAMYDDILAAKGEISALMAQLQVKDSELEKAKREIHNLQTDANTLSDGNRAPSEDVLQKVRDLEQENFQLQREIAKNSKDRVQQTLKVAVLIQERDTLSDLLKNNEIARSVSDTWMLTRDNCLQTQKTQIEQFEIERQTHDKLIDEKDQLCTKWRELAASAQYELAKLKIEMATAAHRPGGSGNFSPADEPLTVGPDSRQPSLGVNPLAQNSPVHVLVAGSSDRGPLPDLGQADHVMPDRVMTLPRGTFSYGAVSAPYGPGNSALDQHGHLPGRSYYAGNVPVGRDTPILDHQGQSGDLATPGRYQDAYSYGTDVLPPYQYGPQGTIRQPRDPSVPEPQGTIRQPKDPSVPGEYEQSRPVCVTGHDLLDIKKAMNYRFEPGIQGSTEVKAYLDDIEDFLSAYGHVDAASKARLIRYTAAPKVHDFIKRQSERDRNDWVSLRRLLIEEYTDYGVRSGISAALTVHQKRDEPVNAYYNRMRTAYFGDRTEPDLDETREFKTLFLDNLQPAVKEHIPLGVSPNQTARSLKHIARLAFDRERPSAKPDRELYDPGLDSGYSSNSRSGYSPGERSFQRRQVNRGRDQRTAQTALSWRRNRSPPVNYDHSSRDGRYRDYSRDRSQSPSCKIPLRDESSDEPESLRSSNFSPQPEKQDQTEPDVGSMPAVIDMETLSKMIAEVLLPQIASEVGESLKVGRPRLRRSRKRPTTPDAAPEQETDAPGPLKEVLCLSVDGSAPVACDSPVRTAIQSYGSPVQDASGTENTLCTEDSASIYTLRVDEEYGHDTVVMDTSMAQSGGFSLATQRNPAVRKTEQRPCRARKPHVPSGNTRQTRRLAKILQKGVHRRLFLPVTLQREVDHEALLDTAADISVMSRSVFLDLQLRARRANREMHLLSHPIRIRPYAKTTTHMDQALLCRIQVGHMTVEHPIYVSELERVPLLLGRDFILRFRPIIDLSEEDYTLSTDLLRPDPVDLTDFVKWDPLQEGPGTPLNRGDSLQRQQEDIVLKPTQYVCPFPNPDVSSLQTPPLSGGRIVMPLMTLCMLLVHITRYACYAAAAQGGTHD